MPVLFLDFETYYDQEYSLKKMTPPQYILDRRFENICCAVAVDDEASHVVDGPQFGEWLSQFDPDDTVTVTFNALFDNAILAWRYGFVPKRMYDPMAMGRALYGHKLKRQSLSYMLDFFNAPMRKGHEIAAMKGVTRSLLLGDAEKTSAFYRYANDDNEGSRWLWRKFCSELPQSEQRLLNLVLRCCIVPRFVLDVPMLQEHLKQVKLNKEQMLDQCGITKSDLMSTLKFRAMLEALGVEIGMKPSPSDPEKEIPAFSKTDKFMEELQEHADPRVQLLATARLGHKSTIEETRVQRFIDIGLLPWTVTAGGGARLYKGGGTMPVPLAYGGPHTHRLAGEWKLNLQNMPTVRGSKGKSRLRQSLVAPPGHCVIVADLGQIEARLGAWVTMCDKLLEQFAKKLDPYNMLASAVFGRPVNRKLVGTPDEVMGFIGKTGILGLGYGAGENKFLTMVLSSARSMGVDLTSIGGYDLERAQLTVSTYRKEYYQVKRDGWDWLNNCIKTTWSGRGGSTEVGFGPGNVVVISKGRVLGPNGLALNYNDPRILRFEKGKNGTNWGNTERAVYGYDYGDETDLKIYGAKFLENIVQFLARIVVMNAALRLADRGYEFVLQAHDELVFVVPIDDCDRATQIIHEEMTRRPSWARDLPLTADVNHGASYGEAK